MFRRVFFLRNTKLNANLIDYVYFSLLKFSYGFLRNSTFIFLYQIFFNFMLIVVGVISLEALIGYAPQANVF